ncbi:ComEA family DNA-binding protein [Demequina sp. SYSU T00192]|uniref:ComEA family DNA-binding protein n=1 Tax=Demequina litoralis TaxID=3051660 RepID=A0ABT8GBJ6_9MICO|nr:ComEA family DNA-binding protein [Demequina sp. SYSU T00192]MDN4476515.1 ComEA family DNA-binding protein [Demequina sp. SYSU T00192]
MDLADSSEDVRARWSAGLRDAAARAYAAGHGADPPAPQPTRWRLDARTAATAAAVIAVIAALGWWGLRAEPAVPLVASASSAAATAAPARSTRPVLVVHVSGAVREPGLVELAAGARVADAIARAGGLGRKADESSVNLARPVADGEHIVVGRVLAAGSSGGAGGSFAAGSPARVDLNTADAAALETLPGVGEVIAARIVADREANGPFIAVADLERVSGVGPSIIAAIADLATT